MILSFLSSVLKSQVPVNKNKIFPTVGVSHNIIIFLSENSRLFVQDKKLDCNVCKEGSKLGLEAYKGTGDKLVKAWVECIILPNGNNMKQQQTSLREKIFEHKNSESHKKAASIRSESNKKKHFETLLDKHIETIV